MLELAFQIATVALVVITLPGTVELALITIGALLPSPRPPTTVANAARELRVAVIIPVYNEEIGLPRTVRSILGCDAAPVASDIVVMACNTTDRTVEIAKALGCTVLERIDPSRRGKGYGLEFAFRHLQGLGFEGYIIVDADTTVKPNFIDQFRSLFLQGGAAGQCILRVANPQENARTRLMNIAFLAFTYLRPLARHRLGLSSGIFGNGFGVRASVVQKVPYDCYSIAEDLEYHTKLIRSGFRVAFLPDTYVSTEMCTTSSQAKPQRERWEGGRLRVLLEQAPGLLREIVVHRRLAQIEPLLDLLLLPLAYHLVLLAALMLVAGGLALAYADFAVALVMTHVLQAMVIGGAGTADWKALGMAPIYVGRKLLGLRGIVKAARKSTPWRRTERESV